MHFGGLRVRSFVKIAAVFLLVGALVSCGREGKCAKDLLYALLEVCDGAESRGAVYCDIASETENEALRVLSNEEFGFLYLGKKEAPACIEGIEGYALRLPLDTDGFELHVIKCKSPAYAREAAKLLMLRVDKLKGAEILSYAPEGYELYFRGAQVRTKGCYAFLLATPDNSAVIDVIDRNVSGQKLKN